jgi:hypothetical protein
VDADVPTLEELYLKQNSLHKFFRTCGANGSSLFPKLTTLVLAENKLTTFSQTVCLDSLQYLNLNGNQIKLSSPTRHSLVWEQCPNLVRVDLNKVWLSDYALAAVVDESQRFVDMTNLRCVSLRKNDMYFIDQRVRRFENCPQFRKLDMSWNVVIDDSRTHPPPLYSYQSFQFIENLRMEGCKLGGASGIKALKAMSHFLPNLVTLDISENSLRFIPPELFDWLPKLQHLDLSNNLLTAVPPDTFGAVLKRSYWSLSLYNNPFSCNCDIMWFKTVLTSYLDRFEFASDNVYHCYIQDQKVMPLLMFHLSTQACLMSHDAYVAITYVTLLTIVSASSAVAVWRFKWHLRLFLYDMFHAPGDARRRKLQV